MDQFITVLAWSCIPAICSIVPVILELIVFNERSENIDLTDQNMITTGLFYLLQSVKIVLAIWSLFILVKGIAVLQKFNMGKSLLNLILSVGVVVIFLCVVFALIYIFH